MKKYVYSLLLLLLTISCVAQDDARSYQPQAYNRSVINNLANKYKSQAIDLTKYLPRNFVKDGSKDYTEYIQKGINENNNVLMPNFPILVSDLGLKLRSNSVILFNTNSKIRLAPSKKDTYNILELHRVNNVQVFNPRIEGDINSHLGSGGEWGMGIAIRSSSQIKIYNAEIINCWGDGIYVGFYRALGSKVLHEESSDIGVYNGYLNNNGRNGISIVAVKGIEVFNNLFANSRRTFPKSGIDIEPGPKLTQNVILKNNVTYNNGARGIDLFFRTVAKNRDNSTSVEIINHKDIGSPIGIRIAGYKERKSMNTVDGSVKIVNPSLIRNRIKAIDVEKDQSKAPNISIKGFVDRGELSKSVLKSNSNGRIRILK